MILAARQRAGTQPVTLEPSRVLEILSLARDHDEMVKALRQDLTRVETKLRFETKYKWHWRLSCIVLGVLGVLAVQDEGLMTSLASSLQAMAQEIQAKGNASLFILIVTGIALYFAFWAIRRGVREPTPEQQARKLMQQFAKKDGVAAYVFTNETPEEEAETIGALAKAKNKDLRKRHFTASHRTLQSSMTRLLNRIEDGSDLSLLH